MKKIFLDLDGTLAKFNVRNALNRFQTEKGFFANLKAYKGIENINELAKEGNVYIISASPNEQADKDKATWIDLFLPNLPKSNICFCRLGKNKAKEIEKNLNVIINKECILLDDYTQNLVEWENVGGVGIKRLTSVANNKSGRWKGLAIRNLKELAGVVTLV